MPIPRRGLLRLWAFLLPANGGSVCLVVTFFCFYFLFTAAIRVTYPLRFVVEYALDQRHFPSGAEEEQEEGEGEGGEEQEEETAMRNFTYTNPRSSVMRTVAGTPP